ncbi:MAG: hypothetical protein H6721_11210 [Sandaracinus sp.]|nr:hypothetical protein [Sandaracinus sp.]MCB9619107.1 hypothetical protein [Sandaracinus sp.]MCB9632690.1 hypothetical protein [Sandaracinus sp.]
MSLLLDLYFPPECVVDATFDDIVTRSVGATGETKLAVDDRVVTRWHFGRADAAESARLETLFRFAVRFEGTRWVFDRSSREGTFEGTVSVGDPDIVKRMRDVFAGVKGDEGVVKLVVVAPCAR